MQLLDRLAQTSQHLEGYIGRLRLQIENLKRRSALVFRLKRGQRFHEHEVGEVTVYETRAAAEAALGHAHDEEGSNISFLKEQAWRLDFSIAEVKNREIAPTLRVFGALEPQSEGRARVS